MRIIKIKPVRVYGLLEDGSDEFRYIGQSVYPNGRLNMHMKEPETAKSPKSQWIRKCKSESIEIRMIILETCEPSIGEIREQYWIDFYIEKGHRLTNARKVAPTFYNLQYKPGFVDGPSKSQQKEAERPRKLRTFVRSDGKKG